MTLSPRSVAGVTALQAAALAAPTLVALWADLIDVGINLGAAVTTALVWELVFAGARKRPFSLHGITTALLVALFCPLDIEVWQIAVAMTLGVIFGELIFGGRGFGFVSGATLALSVLTVAFPDVALRAPTPEIAMAILPGFLMLFATGLVSMSVIAGCVSAVLAMLAASGQVISLVPLAVALAPGLIFLIADPTVACVTPLGRWAYGLAAGALVVLFSAAGGMTPETIVAAALLASVFAPLIDHGAGLVQLRLKSARSRV